jgi:hypothetical protein
MPSAFVVLEYGEINHETHAKRGESIVFSFLSLFSCVSWLKKSSPLHAKTASHRRVVDPRLHSRL